MPDTFDGLTEKQQELYYDKAAELLTDLWWCTRVWEAWNVGTMTRDDFIKADEDDEIVVDAARVLFKFVREEMRKAKQDRGPQWPQP